MARYRIVKVPKIGLEPVFRIEAYGGVLQNQKGGYL